MDGGDQFPFNDKYDWKSKVFLGEGAFGKVFKVKNIKDNQFYAIKQMKMEQFNKEKMLMDSLLGEIKITMQVNSEHTVKMLDSKIGKKYTYIILQLCDTDLRKDLASRKYTEAECVHAFSEIMKGFQVLVGKGYIHRDVKPANTLIKNKHFKVSDFGFACKADILGKKKLNDICGTPLYMAPQLLKNQPYTAKSDIWSLALMFYEMLFGYPPWPCRSLKQYMNNIYTKPVPFPFDAKIGQNTKDFLQKALVVNEDKRISWAEVFNHPIIKGKEAGSIVKQVKINVLAHGIILKFQQHCTKTNVNWMNIANKYSKQKIDFKGFKNMISEIYPSFGHEEIEAIFNHLDSNKKGSIQWSTVENVLIKIDYRPHNDIFSRKIDQIAAIIRERKMDPSELFDAIDLNKSKSLDYEEFSGFIRAIAPCYTKQEITQIFKLFDLDKSGSLSKNEFLELFCKRLQGNKEEDVFVKQRVTRNLGLFKKYVKEHKMTAESILKLADKSNKKAVDMKEFTDLVLNRFKIDISHQEIVELFAIMNKNKNNLVCIDELTLIIK